MSKGEDNYIEDLNSNNGTFLNGEAIQDRKLLKDNDRIRIACYEMEFKKNR